VLLFNDEKNTKEFVIQTLVKFIPGMTAEKVIYELSQYLRSSSLWTPRFTGETSDDGSSSDRNWNCWSLDVGVS
jgi:hypothetical protein